MVEAEVVVRVVIVVVGLRHSAVDQVEAGPGATEFGQIKNSITL
jgi:hypothetical protein